MADSKDYPVLSFKTTEGTQVLLVIDEYNNLYHKRIDKDGTDTGWRSADRDLKGGTIQPLDRDTYLTKDDAKSLYVDSATMKDYLTTNDLAKLDINNVVHKADLAGYISKDELASQLLDKVSVKSIKARNGVVVKPDENGIVDISTLLGSFGSETVLDSGVNQHPGTSLTDLNLLWSGTTNYTGETIVDLDIDLEDDKITTINQQGLQFKVWVRKTPFTNGQQQPYENLNVVSSADSSPVAGYYVVNVPSPISINREYLNSSQTIKLTGIGEGIVGDPDLTITSAITLKYIGNKKFSIKPVRGQVFNTLTSGNNGAYYDPYITQINTFTSASAMSQLANGTVLWEGSVANLYADKKGIPVTLSDQMVDNYGNVGTGVYLQFSGIKISNSTGDSYTDDPKMLKTFIPSLSDTGTFYLAKSDLMIEGNKLSLPSSIAVAEFPRTVGGTTTTSKTPISPINDTTDSSKIIVNKHGLTFNSMVKGKITLSDGDYDFSLLLTKIMSANISTTTTTTTTKPTTTTTSTTTKPTTTTTTVKPTTTTTTTYPPKTDVPVNLLKGTSDQPQTATGGDYLISTVGTFNPNKGMQYTVGLSLEQMDHNVVLQEWTMSKSTRVKLILTSTIGIEGHHVITFTAPTSDDYDSIAVQLAWTNGSDTGSYTWSKAKVEVGNIATDWSPNPSDGSTTTTTTTKKA